MTIENEWYPLCFQTRKEYKEWKYYQRGCDEVCNVCDDCTSDYMAKMIDQQRCNPKEVIQRTTNSKKKVKL